MSRNGRDDRRSAAVGVGGAGVREAAAAGVLGAGDAAGDVRLAAAVGRLRLRDPADPDVGRRRAGPQHAHQRPQLHLPQVVRQPAPDVRPPGLVAVHAPGELVGAHHRRYGRQLSPNR